MQKMTEDEIRAFLLEEPAHTGKLASIQRDGSPHVVPIWYDLDGGEIVFTTWHEAAKAANMERDPRVTLCVDDEKPPYTFAEIRGRVEIEKKAENILYWATRLAGRYMGHELASVYGQRNGVEGEWLVRLIPEKMIGRKKVASLPDSVLQVRIRPLTERDEEWVLAYIDYRWGSDRMVAHGTLYYPHTLPGFVAVMGENQDKVGLLTYHIAGDEWEIISLDSELPGQGVGAKLIETVKQAARDAGARRLWLITTNDNLGALRFYQKRGFTLVDLRPNALERSRQIKPEIPLVGADGIPLRDEIELEFILS